MVVNTKKREKLSGKGLLKDLQELVKIRSSYDNLYQFIKERVSEAGKREVVRSSSEVFERDLVVITDRKRVKGFYVNLKTVKFLPPEVQAFFFLMLDSINCNYFVGREDNNASINSSSGRGR